DPRLTGPLDIVSRAAPPAIHVPLDPLRPNPLIERPPADCCPARHPAATTASSRKGHTTGNCRLRRTGALARRGAGTGATGTVGTSKGEDPAPPPPSSGGWRGTYLPPGDRES